MVKKNDRSTRRFDSFRNFNCFTFTYKILWVRRFTSTGNHLQCFDTGGRDQRFKLLEVFHIFVLRKIDVYQYRLLTSIITVKQAYNPLNRSAGNAGSLAPRVKKQPETLFGFFAVLLRGSILRAATMMVVTAGTATGVVTVMRNRARRDNSRNRVLVNHLADRVFQQDHELIKRLDLPLQLN